MFEQGFEVVVDFVQKHGSEMLLSVVSLFAGSLLGRLIAWRSWMNRAFHDQLNVSLNFVEGGQLQIRTLLDRSCSEVFRNPEMLRRVLAAARSPEGNPLLDVQDEDYWYYLNAVLNQISARFAEGYIRQETQQAASQTYLLFLTAEGGAPVRQKKVRAMLIRESLLLATLDTEPTFRNEFHRVRWESLRAVAQEWQSSGGKSRRIREISISI